MAQQVKDEEIPREKNQREVAEILNERLRKAVSPRRHHDPGLGHKPSYESALAGTPPLEP